MSLKISRILHAGYVFESGEIQIAFDPIFENPFSRNCFAFPEVQFDHEKVQNIKFAAVFISHFHDDHCSLESLNLLRKDTPIYIYCVFEELFEMITALGFTEVHSLKLNVPISIGDLKVTPKRALDSDVDSLFHIEAHGLNILNVVDSWIDPEVLAQLKKIRWDLILWPFQTMRELEVLSPSRARPSSGEMPLELKEQLLQLNPKAIVPSSCQFVQEKWSWYNHALFPISYKLFAQQIHEILPQTQVVRLDPSSSIDLGKTIRSATPLSWIKLVGDSEVDYEYLPKLKAPSTSEIAKNFPALDDSQLKRARAFCETGMLKKFQASNDPYFDRPCLWRLSVFDHEGHEAKFYYKICEDQIERATEGPLGWATEIPLFKLLSALEAGESLTSMYVRINNVVFSPEVEEKIADVELIEDPLVRSLFNGFFGEYQRQQLKKILS